MYILHPCASFRVCEMLYEKRREFDKILSGYWRDTYRKHQAFEYIQYVMTEMHFSHEEKLKVKDEALAHLQVVVYHSLLLTFLTLLHITATSNTL